MKLLLTSAGIKNLRAAEVPVPCYAIDDETAINVTPMAPSRSFPRDTGSCLPVMM